MVLNNDDLRDIILFLFVHDAQELKKARWEPAELIVILSLHVYMFTRMICVKTDP